MRKNSSARAGIKGLYTVYEIRGVNLDRLINYARKQGITLYDVKKISFKRMVVSVNFNESNKFFAIADKMCYNIKKIRHKGISYPIFAIFKSAGLLVGAIVFFLTALLYDDFIVGISFSGSGAIYKRQVQQFLAENGAYEYARFSDIDLKVLEDKTLAENQSLSFVSLKKSGNTLKVELALSTDDVSRLKGDVEELRTSVCGDIESIKVYRGQAMVGVGDSVKVGDLLVDGVVTVKEQQIKTNVLCAVSIIVTSEKHFIFKEDNLENTAVLLAEGEVDDEIILSEVEKIQKNDGYLYIVKTRYRRVYNVG